ncbi:MAG: YCF48-related protein, partial [Bryobacteraceae bacterium]
MTLRISFFRNCLSLALLAVSVASAHQPHDSMLLVATSPNFISDKTVIMAADYLSVSIGVYPVFRSTDGGITYSVMRDLPNLAATEIAFSPAYAADRTIFIAGRGGMFRTTDGGDSWAPIGPLPGAPMNDVALSPAFASDNTMLAITLSNQIWKSTNRGDSWTQMAAPAASLTVVSFNPAYPTQRGILLGTANSGLYRSTNLAASWTQALPGINKVTSIVYSPQYVTDGTIWIGTFGGGVYLSTTSGASFAASNTGITNLSVNSIVASPTYSADTTVFLATTTGVFRSSNGGSSWAAGAAVNRILSTQTTTHYRSLAVGRTGGVNYLFLAMFEGGWMSTNRANSWTDIDMIPSFLIRKLNISNTYATDGTLYATDYGGGALWTFDRGASWSYKNVGLINAFPDGNGISPNFAVDHTAFLGNVTGMQIFGGAAWGPVVNLGAATYARSISPSPNFANDHFLFIGTDNIDTGNPVTVVYNGQSVPNQGVFSSSDGGTTWAPTGLGGPRISSVSLSPNYSSDHTVFASSPGSGLYKSTDSGNTWSSITVVPSDTVILEVDVSPTYPIDSTLIAATSHSGIFKSQDAGLTWTLIPGSDLLTGLNMAMSPAFATDHTIFIGTMQQGLLKSIDGGNTLQPTGLPNAFVMNVVVSPAY